MKKHVKGKRCVLDQDTSVVTNIASLLEENDEYDFIKKEKVFAVDLDENKNVRTNRLSKKELNLDSIIKNLN